MKQRLLFLGLLLAYLLSGVFEVIDNLQGLRGLNFESSAPLPAKVAKEVAILMILIAVRLTHRRAYWLNSTDIMLGFGFAALLVWPTLELQTVAAAQIGYLYLLTSMAVLWAACKAAPTIDACALDHWFLAPAITLILASQVLEIVIAPVSLYNETGLLGLDRRAGLAVVPTTAGCIAALGVYRLRGCWLAFAFGVVLIANSSIGWACTLLMVLARVRDPRLLLVLVPGGATLLLLLISLRTGFEESSTTRLELISDSWSQLHLFLPSPIGALATAKAVALDPTSAFIADASLLQFAHVFGIVPGALLLAGCAFMVWRTTGAFGLGFFVVASSGFLLLEAWLVTLLLVFALARPVRTRRRVLATGDDPAPLHRGSQMALHNESRACSDRVARAASQPPNMVDFNACAHCLLPFFLVCIRTRSDD